MFDLHTVEWIAKQECSFLICIRFVTSNAKPFLNPVTQPDCRSFNQHLGEFVFAFTKKHQRCPDYRHSIAVTRYMGTAFLIKRHVTQHSYCFLTCLNVICAEPIECTTSQNAGTPPK